MEVRRSTRYPVRGRVQVALPNQIILSAHTVDISVEGICIVLQDQIPTGVVCPIRFEMTVNGKDHVITAQAKSIYFVLAGGDGFRAGFAFREDDSQRVVIPVRHEFRSGNNHPKVNRTSNSAVPLESISNKSRFGSVEDEDEAYEPDWEITDSDLATYIDISLRD